MYNLASKILASFLDPLVLAIVLLAGSFFVRKWRPKLFQIAYFASVILLVTAGCPAVEGWLTASLEGQYPDLGADSYPSAQAIVLLGGTIHMPSMVHRASGIIAPSDRLLTALRLYHAEKAPLVFLSGSDDPLFFEKAPEQSEAEVMRPLLVECGVPNAVIELDGDSINTRQNALFSH